MVVTAQILTVGTQRVGARQKMAKSSFTEIKKRDAEKEAAEAANAEKTQTNAYEISESLGPERYV